MTTRAWLGVLCLLVIVPAGRAETGGWWFPGQFNLVNHRLHGQLVDYTDFHGADRRIWSPSLQQCRNLYVYLPPGYDPCQCYPVIMWLHGYGEFENSFCRRVAKEFDDAIASGQLPPVIVVGPSGRLRPDKFIGSLFLNTRLGNFEDYIVRDLWEFITTHYRIRPEREAHVIMGLSTGGWAGFNIAVRHLDMFGVWIGLMPFLNPRYVDCHGHYRSKFDPCCWGLRNELCRNELVGIWYGIPSTLRALIEPFFGWGPEGLAWLSKENPIEVLQCSGLQNGELEMWLANIGKDNMHADAQIESFLYVARQLGLCITVDYRPDWRSHTVQTGIKFIPSLCTWLAPRLAPYSPPLTVPDTCHTEEVPAKMPTDIPH